MNTKTTGLIISANFSALLIMAYLLPTSIFPLIVLEGLFIAVTSVFCGYRKTLLYFSIYSLAVTVKLCFGGGFVALLVFAGGYNLYVLPVVAYCVTFGYAYLSGYLIKRCVLKRYGFCCFDGWRWVKQGVR